NSNGVNWLIGKWSGGYVHYAEGWVSLNTNPDGLRTATNFVPVIGTGTGDTTANSSFYYRNSLDVTESSAPPGNPRHLALGGGTVGGCCNELSTVDISSVIVFNRVLNSTERIIVENFLSAEWGIALNTTSGNDHYAGDQAANGSYNFDVFGIGQVAAGNQ